MGSRDPSTFPSLYTTTISVSAPQPNRLSYKHTDGKTSCPFYYPLLLEATGQSAIAMEDVEFNEDHSKSPLPEAGNDPSDPLRPEIDEENSTPNPTLGDPYQDMEVAESREEMPDNDDIEAGLSDNDSALSDALDDDQLDEQFGDFDASNIAIEERPAQAIDEDTVKQIGVHKRKRTAGEGDEPKKKKKRADKPRRKKNKDGEDGEAADDGNRRSKRSKKEGRVRAASPEDNEENLTPEERKS
jgi:transcription factor SPN1